MAAVIGLVTVPTAAMATHDPIGIGPVDHHYDCVTEGWGSVDCYQAAVSFSVQASASCTYNSFDENYDASLDGSADATWEESFPAPPGSSFHAEVVYQWPGGKTNAEDTYLVPLDGVNPSVEADPSQKTFKDRGQLWTGSVSSQVDWQVPLFQDETHPVDDEAVCNEEAQGVLDTVACARDQVAIEQERDLCQLV